MEIDKHIIDKVNNEHNEVINSSKSAIQHAINAGELLTEIKGMCEHGEFLTIINSSFRFSERTAYNYIKAHEHSAKLQPLANLQEAYKLIAGEEAKKKQAKAEGQREKFAYRNQHNEKPDTWERSDDYAWAKNQDDNKARSDRVEALKRQMDGDMADKEAHKKSTEQSWRNLEGYFEKEAARQEKLKELNIVNENGGFLELIDIYIDSIKTDSEKLEDCHNGIKHLKHIAIGLQKKS